MASQAARAPRARPPPPGPGPAPPRPRARAGLRRRGGGPRRALPAGAELAAALGALGAARQAHPVLADGAVSRVRRPRGSATDRPPGLGPREQTCALLYLASDGIAQREAGNRLGWQGRRGVR